ncbi:hypothetical protein OG2516_18175 [Oceanicola granulosus HTCC2516]|uniref:Invasion associated family protein n=1 Tax=Oceanicola granulosus (strain ATCC BAA-861 / DSM 15982 / KCTC 12143 / HTCC2516) TaxID=314256 RepID=Q2CEK9_OCEGH|nr:invasion associated locus B family protein [Oceanicola granulosus]EAR51123.1 hypothetical protein OG2516_18175 [Oceanicola granulosus HTCC2516]
MALILVGSVLLAAANPAAAQEAPQLPQTMERVGDWQFECFGVSDDGGPCQIYQRVVTGDQNVVALAAAFTVLADGSVDVQLAVPLGISLQLAPQLSLDDEVATSLPVSRCVSDGCLIEGVLEAGLVDRIGNAEFAQVIVANTTGQVFPIPLSLVGFREGMGRLDEVKPEPALLESDEAAPMEAPEDAASDGDDI